MAYLFQSGTLEATNVLYQLKADTGAINSTGSITFGAGDDASVYYNDASGLVLDTKSGKKVDLSAAGTRVAFADSTGFTIEDTLSLYIDTSNVLSETTLGSSVVNSSLTGLGTIATLDAGTGTFSGILKTDDTTDATTNADGSLQTDGGLSVAKAIFNSTAATLAAASGVVTMGSTTAATVSAAGVVNVNNATDATSGTDGSLQTDGGLSVAKAAYVGTTLGVQGISTLGATTGATVSAAGLVNVNNATEATSATDGSLQTDGGLSVVKSAVIGDDLDLLSDGAVLNIGSTSKFTLTDQAANNCVMAASGARLAFGNAGEYITGDGTDLAIVSSGDVDITGDTDVVGGLSSTQASVLASAAGTTTIGSTTGAVFTAAGILNVNNTTDATSGTDGSLQTDGGLSVAKAAYIGTDLTVADDLLLSSTGGVINFDSGNVTLTHASNLLTLAGGTLTAQLTNALSAGAGLSMTSYDGSAAVSDLEVSLTGLPAAVVNVAADSIAIVDADDANVSKKESIADLVSAMAGAGLSATAGVLAVSADSTSINGIGDEADNLDEGMNYGTTTFTANRIWTVPVINGNFSAGDIVRIKAPPLAGYTLTIAINAADQVDDLATGVDLELNSDNASITLQCVVSSAAGKWRII